MKTPPRIPLGLFPTPLHALPRLEAAWGHADIYIKRDDLSGLGPGGSKLRSLEYLLGEAAELHRDRIIVSGPGQSNLCTLTAVSCARLGLPCTLIHNCRPPETYTGNLLLNRLLGAESLFLGDVPVEERRAFERRRAGEAEKRGERPYVIVNGGSTGTGALGYAAVPAEIAGQCAREGWKINALFAPGGNGGIAAGLIYGNALLNRPFNLCIISVEDEAAVLTEHIRGIIAQMEGITGVAFPGRLEDRCEISGGFRGEGWGKNTAESGAAVLSFPQNEGIFIEDVYTAKVAVGMEQYLRKGGTGGVCYLHTGGFGSLFSQYGSSRQETVGFSFKHI